MNAVLETVSPHELHDLMQRIAAEYREMPGLRLTVAQAQKLWNLDRARCEAVLSALSNARVLRRTGDGTFALV